MEDQNPMDSNQNSAPMQQSTPSYSTSSTKPEGKKNSMFIFIVLILAVIVAALLIKKSTDNNIVPQTSSDTMEVEVLDQNASTELSDIEADLNAMTIDDLDADLQ